MAAKKTSSKRSTPSEPSLQQQAEQLQRKLGESAQQIWLAGVGAFGRAQTEGSRLFDTLVKEGGRVEQRAGSRVGEARERAAETLGRVDQAVRSKVQGALKSLEVPTRRELGALLDRIDALNGQLRRHNSQAETPATKARKAATRKTAARKTPAAAPAPARKTAASKAAASKAAPRKVARKTVAKAPAGKTTARKTAG